MDEHWDLKRDWIVDRIGEARFLELQHLKHHGRRPDYAEARRRLTEAA